MNGSLILHGIASITIKRCIGEEFTWTDLDIQAEDGGLFILRVFPEDERGEILITSEKPVAAPLGVAE